MEDLKKGETEGVEETQVQFVYNVSGLIPLIIFFIFSVSVIWLGYWMQSFSVMLWGWVLLFSAVLALIPLSARIIAPKIVAEKLKRMEFESEIRKKIEARMQSISQEEEE